MYAEDLTSNSKSFSCLGTYLYCSQVHIGQHTHCYIHFTKSVVPHSYIFNESIKTGKAKINKA